MVELGKGTQEEFTKAMEAEYKVNLTKESDLEEIPSFEEDGDGFVQVYDDEAVEDEKERKLDIDQTQGLFREGNVS